MGPGGQKSAKNVSGSSVRQEACSKSVLGGSWARCWSIFGSILGPQIGPKADQKASWILKRILMDFEVPGGVSGGRGA